MFVLCSVYNKIRQEEMMPKLQRSIELPQGLLYQSEFLSVQEEQQLLGFIKSLDFHQAVMHGQPAKRVVRHFGLAYDFMTRRTKPVEKMPKELTVLIGKVTGALSLDKRAIVEALITKYPVGAPIGWHRDAEAFGVVIGISLQAPCIMRFRRGGVGEREVYERILNPRSLYVMQGEARTIWEHHIPPTKQERYSVTFRTLR
jgi:alkylated DNA repair protein (DNA oxidative demethylase)